MFFNTAIFSHHMQICFKLNHYIYVHQISRKDSLVVLPLLYESMPRTEDNFTVFTKPDSFRGITHEAYRL